MQLRNGALAGGSPGQLQADRRPAFEEGVLLVFKRWTALCLALDGQWGGSGSADKAQIIYEETLDWFYKKKEHYADDLGMDLEDSFESDFNAKLEDGSPYEVAKVLVLLHNELLQGSAETLDRLRRQAPADVSGSKQQTVDNDGAVISQGQEDGSSSDSGSSDGEDGDAAMGDVQQAEKQHAGPVIDEDGFQLVQRSRGRGMRGQGG
ncbi:g5191 [Coccomyxa viridis]|uniref:G5191 protein n=1 Tax=Coccomyxa viridis TaxID=1274662 RepID=A0ABP1FX62_9CHLO